MYKTALVALGLALINTNGLAQTPYRLLDPDTAASRIYAGNEHPDGAGPGPAKVDEASTRSWKKPLGITIIVVGSVVGSLFALYSLGTAPGPCGENYEPESPELKECENESSQAMLGFMGGLAIAGASIAGGVVLIKMSRNRGTHESRAPLVTNHDLSLQWTYAF